MNLDGWLRLSSSRHWCRWCHFSLITLFRQNPLLGFLQFCGEVGYMSCLLIKTLANLFESVLEGRLCSRQFLALARDGLGQILLFLLCGISCLLAFEELKFGLF